MSLDHADDSLVESGVHSPERVISARERLALLDMALQELGPVRRQAFILVRLEGLSYKEVAVRLQIDPVAVGRHVEKTVAHLARRLAEREGAVDG